MREMILAKYGEIALKGLNKATFENLLVSNVKRRIAPLGKVKITREQSTLMVQPLEEDYDLDEAVRRMEQVFGIAALARAAVLEKNFEAIQEQAPAYVEDALSMARTFKVEAKRSDKRFPMKSPEICRELGGTLLERFPHLTVDVKNPDVTVTVEIRDEFAFLHALRLPGAGGMPVGSSGEALLLLSGGIDSPVAGWMMAKRGVHISAVHFVSPPYTSERARMKVERLCQKLAGWCGSIRLSCVPFTEIQEKIRDHCPEELTTIILRRLMLEIAQRIAVRDGQQSLVTGESIGQVASQTMGAIVCTDAAVTMPVFRPVIGMDKQEITAIARKIDTFDISIEPYEDCCTVFTPKHPKTRPQLEEVEAGQARFDFEPLIQEAVEKTQAEIFSL